MYDGLLLNPHGCQSHFTEKTKDAPWWLYNTQCSNFSFVLSSLLPSFQWNSFRKGLDIAISSAELSFSLLSSPCSFLENKRMTRCVKGVGQTYVDQICILYLFLTGLVEVLHPWMSVTVRVIELSPWWRCTIGRCSCRMNRRQLSAFTSLDLPTCRPLWWLHFKKASCDKSSDFLDKILSATVVLPPVLPGRSKVRVSLLRHPTLCISFNCPHGSWHRRDLA